ncbi:MAG: glycosyltransferase family 2 protein [Lachnospiraceae bacterium]|nr:glycosyltransferase family 2 protein [Lachnospiraceae bacterium]
MLYSVVVPVYNSAGMLDELYNRIKAVFESVIREDFELILVDDFSKDDSFSVMKRLGEMDGRVKYIRLARNHGQQKAVLCGIEHTSGDYVITMDDDLQHPPEEIPKLIAKMESDPDIDVVIGMYDSKKHNGIRLLGTKMLDGLSNIAFKKNKDLKLTSFRLMKSFVADNLSEVNLKAPTVGHCLLMVDGNMVNTLVHHDARGEGKSGYSFKKLVRAFMANLYSNSDLPLRFIGSIGTTSFVVSMVLIIYYLIKYFGGHVGVSGFTTLVILVLLMNGLSLFSVGIMGRYLMLAINEIKRLPKYTVKEKNVDKKRSTD